MLRYLFGFFLLVVPSAALCSSVEWQWNFAHTYFFGTSPKASDVYDSLDNLTPGYFAGRLVGMYHEQGADGWNGPTGFYSNDIRSSLEITPGNSKTWRIYLWNDLDYDPTRQYTNLNWFPGTGITPEVLSQIEFRLTYIRPAVSVSDDLHNVGEYWLFNDRSDGGNTGPFPAYRTSNGLDGYIFDFTATVVPEPSSLLALAAGVATFAGMVRRRR